MLHARGERKSNLEPVDTPPARSILRSFALEQFDHQPFTAVFDTVVKEDLNILDIRCILGSSECKFPFDRME